MYPRYILEGSGPEHTRIFTAQVFIGEEKFGEGVGRSKKIAEQDAAHAGLEIIENKI